MTRIPEIIAHRGAPREALENTLTAFQIALDQGADGIELDVHATRDGVVVVHHDAIFQAADGAGVTRTVRVSETDADVLRTYRLAGGETVPTLDEVFTLVQLRATLYVEVKASAIEAPLLACIDRHPAQRVAVHAFDHRIPVSLRGERPHLSIGVLSASYPLSLQGFVGTAHPNALWQQAQLIDAALVDAAHGLGVRVIAWTENDAVHAHSLIAMGVDALCTDTPGLLRAALVG